MPSSPEIPVSHFRDFVTGEMKITSIATEKVNGIYAKSEI